MRYLVRAFLSVIACNVVATAGRLYWKLRRDRGTHGGIRHSDK